MSIDCVNGKQKKRAILTAEQAMQIYKYEKHCSQRFYICSPFSGNAIAVAKKYCISPKTVRDIWHRRTWTKETRHLWASTDEKKIRRKKSDPSIALSHGNNETTLYKDSKIFGYAFPIKTDYATFREDFYDVLTVQRIKPDCLECSMTEKAEFPGEIDDSPENVDPFHADWPFWSNNMK